MKAQCLICHRDTADAKGAFLIHGQGAMGFWTCPSCLADARLGRLVRKAFEHGERSLWFRGMDDIFMVCVPGYVEDYELIARGSSLDEALEKAGVKEASK